MKSVLTHFFHELVIVLISVHFPTTIKCHDCTWGRLAEAAMQSCLQERIYSTSYLRTTSILRCGRSKFKRPPNPSTLNHVSVSLHNFYMFWKSPALKFEEHIQCVLNYNVWKYLFQELEIVFLPVGSKCTLYWGCHNLQQISNSMWGTRL